MFHLPSRRAAAAILLFASAAALVSCGGGSGVPPEEESLTAEAAIGKLAFHDASLSASGRVACASCHDPQTGHAPANDLAVQLGGTDADPQGMRAAPSLRYLVTNGGFHFTSDGTPVGGFFWDGRADQLWQQAEGPLLNPLEMANSTKQEVVERIKAAEWASRFKAAYGDAIFDDADRAVEMLARAIQQYQLEDEDFHAFTSKYDAVLRGQAQLAPQEERGLALFNDPAKGNCAACHTSAKMADGSHPLFTDFSYDNIGVPRNMEIAANADPAYYDLGLCARWDLLVRDDLCGAFKVPTLRNVAIKRAYFHNGKFKTLKDVLTFYAERDTNPEKFYSRNPDGSVHKFDDLPAALVRDVNTTEAPYNRRPGDAPALTDAEIDDVIAFLRALTDGWAP